MEERAEQVKRKNSEGKKARVIACFQQPQTIGILNYLSVDNSTVSFQSHIRSGGEHVKKKSRDFKFDSVFVREAKMRMTLGPETSNIITSLVEGRDQALLLYGIEQPFKQKLLYGDPRDPGLILLFMEQLFSHCHKMKMENQVTVKISFASYERGKFRDLLVNSKKPLKLCRDSYQGDYLLGQSEIIVRNIKTAVKITKIASTNCLNNRQDEQIGSECMIFQIKLEVEMDKDSEKYQISKLKLIKFGDPSLGQNPFRPNDTMKINERNRWAINLDNCLRECCMLDHSNSKNLFHKDDMTAYMRSIIIGEAEITCYISLTNKLSQNDCLNCLLFSYYISKIDCKVRKTVLDVGQIRSSITSVQMQLNIQLQDLAINHPECKLFQVERLAKHRMQLCFELECQFSKLLSASCNVLSKYVMNQDIEEFFYCKKESISGSPEVLRLLELIHINQDRIQQSIATIQHIPALKDLDKTILKSIHRLLNLYKTASVHFFYQRSQLFKKYCSESRKSSLRHPRLSSIHRGTSRENFGGSTFKSDINPYSTQQNLKRPKQQKIVEPKPIPFKQRPRPVQYDDYVQAMFFNQGMSAL